MRPVLSYTGCRLDRFAPRRGDHGWLADLRQADAVRAVPVWRDRSLVLNGDPPTAAALVGETAWPLLEAADAVALLGVGEAGEGWFAVDISSWDEAAAAALLAESAYLDLRRVSGHLSREEGSLLAYARGLMRWHARSRFCSVCGGRTESRQGGHMRRCTNEACRSEYFPRTDPAIIVLVTRPGPDGGACLLGRQHRWPAGMMSTLAGFVEPGESVEEAVAREVEEEVGMVVTDVAYVASQPWPFPSSVMLGFRACVEAGVPILLDRQELEDARWFTRAELASIRDFGFKLPHRDSIARWLVETWMHEATA